MSKIIRHGRQIQSMHFNTIEGGVGGRAVSSPGMGLSKSDIQAVIEEASQKAANLIGEAEARVLLIEQEAYQRGYHEGLELARNETVQMVASMRSAAEQAIAEKWRVINDVEANIVELALQVAEKVIGEHVKVSPDVVAGIARKALTMAAEREQIRIKVNPDDLEVMKAHKEDLLMFMDGIQKIEVLADRRVGRGGCVLETASGNVDARIQSQLSQVEQSLMEVIDNG